jgi:hypothetical protein
MSDIAQKGEVAILEKVFELQDALAEAKVRLEAIQAEQERDKSMTVTIDQPPVDLTPVIDALESLKEALPTIPESKEVDMTPVVSALQDLQNTLALDNQYPEDKDYTEHFTALLEALSKPTLEKEILEALSRPYPEFNIPTNIISSDGRIKVEVDKVNGGGSDKLAKANGVYINPATEEKQDAIVTAIENIAIEAPVGGATEAKQDAIITALGNVKIDTGDIDLNTDGLEALGTATNTKLDSEIALQTTLVSLTETLQELSRRLLVLASMANAGAPALRTIPIASVSTAVTGTLTAVTTVGSVTNFGTGVPAKEMADDMNNLIVTQGNISNVTA